MNIAKESLRFSGLYEAELLLELMLRYWKHPSAADADFPSSLIESATEGLRLASEGNPIIEGLAAQKTNFVAAIWCAEAMAVAEASSDEQERTARQLWCDTVRRCLPSCFCDPQDLV